jgi:2-hydroxychromene-2-carboxylate isomerase
MTTLMVAIDFKSPQSYLAKAPTRELAKELGVAIDWEPVRARPLTPPAAETTHDDRGTRHRRFRALYFERDLHRYARAQGLALGDVYRSPDSSLAGMGLLWVKRHAAGAGARGMVDDYVDRVFDGYFGARLDLEDLGALRAVIEAVGAPGDAFSPEAMRAEYDGTLARLREAGAIEAPAYLVGGDVFIGRQHLPMIRWLLEGKTGAPPI